MITLRNKTVSQTFLPSFDNPNGRLCQERLFWSRNFATMVTWRHTSALLLRLTLARIKTLGILLDEDWERDCFNTSSVRAIEPASFWRENATDIVVLVLRCSENDAAAETSHQMLKVVSSCDRARAQPLSIKWPCQLFWWKKERNEAFGSVYFLRILVLVVFLILESRCL